MSKIPHISHPDLKRMMDYDPTTGIFTWRVRYDVRPQWNGRYAGKRAGHQRTATGGGLYWSVRIHDWPFHANRLAWFYMTGSWPVGIVDHKNLNGTDDRWSNLRLATKSQNAANAPAPKSNTSGFKGVSFDKRIGKYRSYIRNGNRQQHLGYFDCAEKAAAAYRAAAGKVFKEFARA